MALTLEDYRAIAPDVVVDDDFTLVQIEDALSSVPDSPPPPVQPEATKAKRKAVFQIAFSAPTATEGIANAGGYGAVAKVVGLWKSQVVSLVDQMQTMKNLYDSDQS